MHVAFYHEVGGWMLTYEVDEQELKRLQDNPRISIIEEVLEEDIDEWIRTHHPPPEPEPPEQWLPTRVEDLTQLRTSLGLGSDIGTLAVANGGTSATTAAGARNNLGLGNTTGPLPIANGGTAATTAAAARAALGILGTGGTVGTNTSYVGCVWVGRAAANGTITIPAGGTWRGFCYSTISTGGAALHTAVVSGSTTIYNSFVFSVAGGSTFKSTTNARAVLAIRVA